jgi:hypothetical protein
MAGDTVPAQVGLANKRNARFVTTARQTVEIHDLLPGNRQSGACRSQVAGNSFFS